MATHIPKYCEGCGHPILKNDGYEEQNSEYWHTHCHWANTDKGSSDRRK